MRVLFLQHVSFEGLGSINSWIKKSGHSLKTIRLYANDPLPSLDEFDVLIIMGGPMGIYDYNDYPWLREEKALIKESIALSKKVLGICLGAQLIADVLGAKVERNRYKEIGWFEIIKTSESRQIEMDRILPEKIEVFHWHGDTFSIPNGAIRLFRSEACENQAFVYKENVLALQFHLEMMYQNGEEIIENGLNELSDAPYIQKPSEMLADKKRFNLTNKLMNNILEFFINDISRI